MCPFILDIHYPYIENTYLYNIYIKEITILKYWFVDLLNYIVKIFSIFDLVSTKGFTNFTLLKDAVLFLINKYLHRKGNAVSNDVLAKAKEIIDCEEHLNQDLG